MSFYLFRKWIRELPGVVIKMVPKPEPAVTIDYGARDKIGGICANATYRSALIVADQTIYSLGLHEKVVQSLEANDIKYTVFYNIVSEPTIDIVSEGRKMAIDCGADTIIALGGGSVLDACKIIAAGAKQPKRSTKALLRKLVYVCGGTLPIIAVPSTSGTGAEITVGAVISNEKGI